MRNHIIGACSTHPDRRTDAAGIGGPGTRWRALIRLAAVVACLVLGGAGAAGAAAPDACDSPESSVVDTPAARWVVSQLCQGDVADLNDLLKTAAIPALAAGWTTERQLSARFLKHLLTTAPFQRARANGVRIAGAWFADRLDLTDVRLDNGLWIERSRFEANVRMPRVQIGRVLSFEGSWFAGALDLTEARLSAALRMEGARVGRLDAGGADVERQADLDNIRIEGRLAMNEIRVGQSLDMRDAAFLGGIDLRRAKIGGSLRLEDTSVAGAVDMDSIDVAKSIEAWRVEWVGGTDGLLADEAEAPVWKLYNARIGGSFYLAGGAFDKLQMLNLTGTRIDGELFLGSKNHPRALSWGRSAQLVLNNTTVGSLQDERRVWPDRLELSGFSYERWGGLGREVPQYAGLQPVFATRDKEWLMAWLKKDASYSLQPYEQLARVLRQSGRTQHANEILYAGRDEGRRLAVAAAPPSADAQLLPSSDTVGEAAAKEGHPAEMVTAAPGADAIEADETGGIDAVIVLTLSRFFNGYGYRPERALVWFAGLIALGALIFHVTYRGPDGQRKSMFYSLEYSLDTLLPAVNLRKEFEGVSVQGWTRYYFIALKVCGYMFVATIIQVFDRISGN
jgi:hypothetical protein